MYKRLNVLLTITDWRNFFFVNFISDKVLLTVGLLIKEKCITFL